MYDARASSLQKLSKLCTSNMPLASARAVPPPSSSRSSTTHSHSANKVHMMSCLQCWMSICMCWSNCQLRNRFGFSPSCAPPTSNSNRSSTGMAHNTAQTTCNSKPSTSGMPLASAPAVPLATAIVIVEWHTRQRRQHATAGEAPQECPWPRPAAAPQATHAAAAALQKAGPWDPWSSTPASSLQSGQTGPIVTGHSAVGPVLSTQQQLLCQDPGLGSLVKHACKQLACSTASLLSGSPCKAPSFTWP